jgi:hypothetical protein
LRLMSLNQSGGLFPRLADNLLAMRSLRLLGLVLAATGCLLLPSAALAVTQSAHSGDVSATFTFKGKFPNYFGERLQIVRAGSVAYDHPVSSMDCSPCAPGAPEANASSVRVVDIESDGEPDVLLDLYSGGAHCCLIAQIFSYDPVKNQYVRIEHDFGDPGYRLLDLRHDGHKEFVTADDSFAYEFTDYAASGLPLQILTFAAGTFTDVTRQYPKLIRKDAARWMRAFKHHYVDGLGLIAAWAADEELLGHAKLVKRTLAQQLREGHLRTPLSPHGGGGAKFVRRLNKFLHKHGYIS